MGRLCSLLGVAVGAAGVFIFLGAAQERLVGVIDVAVWAIVGFAWTPYRPVWGIALLAILMMVIWAPAVHGSTYTEGDRAVGSVRLARVVRVSAWSRDSNQALDDHGNSEHAARRYVAEGPDSPKRP